MTTRILFLDDDSERHTRFTSHCGSEYELTKVWSYDQAVQALTSQITPFDMAFLDHDLSDVAAAGRPGVGEKTGTDVAEFIASMDPDSRPKYVTVHSHNPYGAKRMAQILDNAGVRVRLQRFGF